MEYLIAKTLIIVIVVISGIKHFLFPNITWISFFRNIGIINAKYVLQAYYRTWIRREYERLFIGQQLIDKEKYKIASCPQCFLDGEMKCCGCDWNQAVLTDKKCKDGKF